MLNRWLEKDAEWTERVRVAETPGPIRKLAAILAHSGDSWLLLVGLALLWFLGPEEWKRMAAVMMVCVLITAVVVLVIKFSVRRRRPQGEWGEVYRKTDPHSFPSGHSVRAVMLAVLALGLGPLWFGVLLAIWAPLVALSRAAMGVHYLSDIVAGALLGALLGGLYLVILPRLSFLA